MCSNRVALHERRERAILGDRRHGEVAEATLERASRRPGEKRIAGVGVDGGMNEILRAVDRGVADDRSTIERHPAVGAVRATELVGDVLAHDLGDPESCTAARRQQVEDPVEIVESCGADVRHAATVPSLRRPHRLVA